MTPRLLTRDEFREQVFSRHDGFCSVRDCFDLAADAHHIVERRLWPDGGYYIENGAAVCEKHHRLAEMTVLPTWELRYYCGIDRIVLPPHLPPEFDYDKWGNIVNEDGTRVPGELFWDESVQQNLRKGGVLDLFETRVKYPRTLHLPTSQGRHHDDVELADFRGLVNARELVVTEKMDGENTTFYRDAFHARSLDSAPHASQDRVKAIWARIAHDIPEGWRISGENLYAMHSIEYHDLEDYFLVFGIWNERGMLLSWDETEEWSALIGLNTVPVIGTVVPNGSIGALDSALNLFRVYERQQSRDVEGFVVRDMDTIQPHDFRKKVAKWVRRDHVRTLDHGWRYRNDFKVNRLKETVTQ